MTEYKIRVNTNSLKATQDKIKDGLAGIKTDLSVIAEHMAELNALWTGEAHDTFVSEINSDITFLQSVCDVIQSVISYEGNAVTEYEKCENQVSELIAQIHI